MRNVVFGTILAIAPWAAFAQSLPPNAPYQQTVDYLIEKSTAHDHVDVETIVSNENCRLSTTWGTPRTMHRGGNFPATYQAIDVKGLDAGSITPAATGLTVQCKQPGCVKEGTKYHHQDTTWEPKAGASLRFSDQDRPAAAQALAHLIALCTAH